MGIRPSSPWLVGKYLRTAMSDADITPLSEGDSPHPALSLEQSLAAVRLYLHTGSIAEVGRQLSVTVYELNKLTRTQWWMQELRLLRTIEQAQLDTSLTEILNVTLAELKQRLEFGEDYYDKEGNMRNRPLPAATLCRIADVVFDKRQLIRGLPTAVTNEGGKLQDLADKLEQLGRAQSARTIEMDPTPPPSSFEIED